MFRIKISRIASNVAQLILAASVALGLPAAASAADHPDTVNAGIAGIPGGSGTLQTAVLAGGCFWGTQGVFEHVKGVRKVLAGYSGGDRSTADYESVSSGRTGHAESIQITFDPAVVSYADLLRVFFSVAHDPTELNRQGPDTGTQYRSEIFFADDSQQKTALAYIAQLEQAHIFGHPIVTRVDPLKGFYPAEGYHQDFLVRNPRYPYIVYNDLPKIANLQRELPDIYVDKPVLAAATR
ncbi:MAG TPA: peptide-methionine (S)-S-oxide reductase MsrA [Steroidobacteraceae bacterium]|nr:peptide-methionine (S)-S-oxide reductase MsrA [Steroidobacteraceae bacterium]